VPREGERTNGNKNRRRPMGCVAVGALLAESAWRSKCDRRQTPACRTRAERRVVVLRRQTRARWRRSFARASCAAAPPASRWTTGGTPRA
jgi:hypothetical protein